MVHQILKNTGDYNHYFSNDTALQESLEKYSFDMGDLISYEEFQGNSDSKLPI